MAIDPYQLCLCGSGKKIKFCCGKDIVGDLDKILTAVSGEQRVAALDQINHLLKTKGDIDCLVVLKTQILIELNEFDQAKQHCVELLVRKPHNPIARALDALIDIYDGKLVEAVEKIHHAVQVTELTIPPLIIQSMGMVGAQLIQSGQVISGRRLLMESASRQDMDEQAAQLIAFSFLSPRVPVVMKKVSDLVPCADDAPYASEFNEAIRLAGELRWLAALGQFEQINQRHSKQAAVLHNLATMYGWMLKNEEMVRTWRSYAKVEGVPLSQAVEAEALAQLLEYGDQATQIELTKSIRPVQDMDQLMEQLSANRQLSRISDGEATGQQSSGPRPKAMFHLLDRPLPDADDSLQADAVPEVIGTMSVFGKQTDREARVEIEAVQGVTQQKINALMAEQFGGLIGEQQSEESIGELPQEALLAWKWRFPDDTPIETIKRLEHELRCLAVLNEWPHLPHRALGGKTPAEAAEQPASKIPVLAAILLLQEAEAARFRVHFDYNQLREKLGLQALEPIVLDPFDISKISVIELARVSFAELGDEQLVEAYHFAGSMSAFSALYPILVEMTKREAMEAKADMGSVYHMLARLELSDDQAIRYVKKARDIATAKEGSPGAKGDSVGLWLIHELELRLERGIPDQCNELVQQIQARHINEPTIGNELLRVLNRFGLIRQGDMPPGPADEPETATASAESPPAESGLWTPDQPTPAAAGSEQPKSKLWVPGSD